MGNCGTRDLTDLRTNSILNNFNIIMDRINNINKILDRIDNISKINEMQDRIDKANKHQNWHRIRCPH